MLDHIIPRTIAREVLLFIPNPMMSFVGSWLSVAAAGESNSSSTDTSTDALTRLLFDDIQKNACSTGVICRQLGLHRGSLYPREFRLASAYLLAEQACQREMEQRLAMVAEACDGLRLHMLVRGQLDCHGS